VSAAVPPTAHNSFSRLPCSHTTGLRSRTRADYYQKRERQPRIYSEKVTRTNSTSLAISSPWVRISIFSWRFTRELPEHAIELRKRLKSDRERDFADAKIDILQELARMFEPPLRHIIDELGPGYLFELFAEMRRINAGRVCHSYE